MEDTPSPLRVSVLIVAVNCEQALRRCLTALEASTARATIEIIVVDNGSGDGTGTVQQEFPSVTLLRLPRNFGFTRALNIAMRTAKAEAFLFLDPRVEVQPETAGALADALAANSEAVAVAPRLVGARHQFYKLPLRATLGAVAAQGAFDPAPPDDAATGPVPVEFASFSALMVRGYFLKGLRYIDERYAQTWGDAELALQIRRAGRKTLFIPEIEATWHDEPGPFDDAPSSVQTVLAADWISGASTYAGKHFGMWPALSVKIGAAFRALAGFRLGLLTGVLSGRRIDGT
ncbi:MAG TPA: glycosyltransferase [Bryobacteraceae bacterium]|nr:glycosyltransferase [Bryobacteraceae bacterium]